MSASLVDATPRRLGRDGPPTAALALGCWRMTSGETSKTLRLVETAIDAGISLLDTADVYGLDHGGKGFGENEAHLGAVLAANPSLRSQITLATKGGILPPTPYDSSPAYIRKAVDASLTRLQTDHVDLWQVHRADFFTHPADLAGELDSLVRAGKIGHIGVSNHSVHQQNALAAHLENPIVSTQPEFSVVTLDPIRDGTLDSAMANGITPLAWSPLAGGRLVTGEGVSPELLTTLDQLAARESTDRATVAIAFLLAHPSRPVVILGTQNPERLKRACDAYAIQLDRADVYQVMQASEGQPLP